MTGATFEQSLSLEPSQIAGFTQNVSGCHPGSRRGRTTPATPFDTYGLALEQKFRTGTYLGLSGQVIQSAFDRAIGGYPLGFDPNTYTYSVLDPTTAQQHLDYP